MSETDSDQDGDDPPACRLVLVNRKTGRFASAKDYKRLATQIYALRATNEGQGGGILGLLLPNDYAGILRLIRMERLYSLENRRRRSSKENNRERARKFVLFDDAGMAKLLALFSDSHPEQLTSGEFAVWIVRSLNRKDPIVYRIIRSHGLHPENLAERRPSWWQNLIAERRKRLKIKS